QVKRIDWRLVYSPSQKVSPQMSSKLRRSWRVSRCQASMSASAWRYADTSTQVGGGTGCARAGDSATQSSAAAAAAVKAAGGPAWWRRDMGGLLGWPRYRTADRVDASPH